MARTAQSPRIAPRIALAGFVHESNSFAPSPADMAETGVRTAAELGRMLAGEPRVAAFRQGHYLIPIAWQATGTQPAAGLYDQVAAADDAGACASLFMGFPAADVADCRPSVLVYAQGAAEAGRIADGLTASLAGAEDALQGECLTPETWVAAAMAAPAGPVVLVDTQHNPGAGGDSDTTGMLRALVEAGATDAAMGLIVDPEAAQILTCAAPGPMPVSPVSLPFRHLTPGIRLEPGGRGFTPHAPAGGKTGPRSRSTERTPCSIE